MRRAVLAAALALAAAAGCHDRRHWPDAPDGPHAAVQVFNQCHETITVDDARLAYWTSWRVYVLNGAVLDVPLSDSAGSLGTLVITSLVPASDAGIYHTAVNLRCDTPGHVYAVEANPEISATVENPRGGK